MFRQEVNVFDAIQTIILMEHCINTGLFEKNCHVLMSKQTYEKAKHECL